jgi:uncharacterized protein YndB with AHSA1/START domain
VSTTTETSVATQVYRVYVKATPEAIWDAFTNPEQTDRYGYGGQVEYELRPGGAYRAHSSEAMRQMGAPDVIVDGEVVEADAPRRLVQTWHALFDPDTAAETPSRLTFELEDASAGVTQLTLTHELDDAPRTAGFVGGAMPNTGGGWAFVLSDLKTLLETGTPLAG